MNVIFIISSLLLTYYYFIFRTKIDIFTLAFLCCEFYFLPGFFGFTTRVFDDRTREYVSCSAELYIIFMLVILFLFSFTMFSDFKIKKIGQTKYKKIDIRTVANTCSIVLIVIIILFLIIDAKNVFGKSKIEYINDISIIYQILRYLIPIVFTFAIIDKNKFAFSISFIGLSIDIYMSNRTVILICIITLMVLLIYNNEKKTIYKYKNILIIIPLICISFLFFERIIEPIQKKDWKEFSRRVTSSETYLDSIIVSEPFITQTILEEIIQKDYTVKENTIINLFNKEKKSFNDQFQGELFPKITKYKMAENIWAEVYANYRLFGVFIMAFSYSLIIYILNIGIIRFRKSIIMPYLCIASANWIFFIHRGSVGNQLIRQKNVILVYVVCLVASYMINLFMRRIKLWRK